MRNLLDRIARLACACIATVGASTARAGDVPHYGHIEAVWKAQSIVLEYRSAGRHYSCGILEYKIKMILRRLGAHDQLKVRPYACRDLAARARFEVYMESPVEATAENIHEITHYDSEDELVARVRGVQLPSPADVERFPAAWESITFRRDRKLDLDAGDCALVQQLRRQILPRMSVQVTRDIKGVDCSQELTGIMGPRLTVLALVPASASQELSR
jgi:hypothetical protein